MDSFFAKSTWLDDVSKSIRLDNPPVVIARLKTRCSDYSELKEMLEELRSQPEVLFANPVLRSAKGEEAPVLQQVFVKIKSDSQKASLPRLSEQMRFDIRGTYSFDKNVFIITPQKFSGMNSLDLACALAGLKLFEYVHPNLLFSPVVATNDPFFTRQWHLRNDGTPIQGNGTPGADMSVEEAWVITRGDTSIKIAILDSGVDTLHPDLAGNLLHGFDATGGGSNGYPSTTYANDGHGTCCAGIVAAMTDNGIGVAGVAPLCKIIPVKIFYYVDTSIGTTNLGVIPYSTTQWMADGINWAAQAGADVMSNSWGVPSFLFSLLPGPVSLAEDAIRNAVSNGRDGRGIPMLFSSGNEDAAAPIWPSSMEETIAVTATSMCDERKSMISCDGEAWGGNYGGALDLAAPGVMITTTDMRGNKGYAVGSYTTDFNGTSAACPNAAGVMALILAVNPALNAGDARYLLASTADKTGGYDYNQNKYAGMWSSELGFGRVNAYKAVQAAMSYTGIVQNEYENFFFAYPNPVTGNQLTMGFELRESSFAEISLTDLSGKIISQQDEEFPAGNHSVSINIPLPAGMYVVHFASGSSQHHQKLLFLGR
ncbi:MAG TPA: S8 family serine peptidase [Chitinophagales bacterium]|nr:S8 family serine peptidase [Chitinophagales bacterium]